MRVASMMMTNRYLKQLNRTYEAQTKLMEQSDGDKLHRASDDAIGYSKYLRYGDSFAENNQYQTNVKSAISWMKNSDAAVQDISDALKTIVEKSNAAQDTNTTTDMQAIAKEMLVKVQQVVADGNMQVNGRYLFSGQSDLKQPYSMSNDKFQRGLTKSLDDKQTAFFNSGKVAESTTTSSGNLSQMLSLTGSDGQTYYLNTLTGKIYSKDFMDEGYKDKMAAGQAYVTAADKLGSDGYGYENPDYSHVTLTMAAPPNGCGGTANLNVNGDGKTFVTLTNDPKVEFYKSSDGKQIYRYQNHFYDPTTGLQIADNPDYQPLPMPVDANGDYNSSGPFYLLKDNAGNKYCVDQDLKTGAIMPAGAAVAGVKISDPTRTATVVGDLYAANQKYTINFSTSSMISTPNPRIQEFFGLSANNGLVEATNASGETFYYNADPDSEFYGHIYTKEFVNDVVNGVVTRDSVTEKDKVADMHGLDVSKNFDSNGVIKEGVDNAGEDWGANIVINGRYVTLGFSKVEQYIITYSGDNNHFSMVKENGATQPATDTVNMNGIDLAGTSIFDDANSGNRSSGAAAFNDVLTVVAMTDMGNAAWMSSDGKTLANNSFEIVNTSQSKLAARQQVYTDCQNMLTTQNESILTDITEVHSTDVAKLATKLMEAQTIYQLSLSVGSRILPPTLADYL